jgi:hypothetical protein
MPASPAGSNGGDPLFSAMDSLSAAIRSGQPSRARANWLTIWGFILRSEPLGAAPFTIQALFVGLPLARVLQKCTARSGEQIGARAQVRAITSFSLACVNCNTYNSFANRPTLRERHLP